MSKFFSKNIDRTGRILRGIWGSLLVAAGIAVCFWELAAGVALLAAGVFAFFEAYRGWCVMRACGIKTRL